MRCTRYAKTPEATNCGAKINSGMTIPAACHDMEPVGAATIHAAATSNAGGTHQ